MNKKNVSWIMGGAVAMAVAGASFWAHGLENRALTTAPVPQAEAHILVAQAETGGKLLFKEFLQGISPGESKRLLSGLRKIKGNALKASANL